MPKITNKALNFVTIAIALALQTLLAFISIFGLYGAWQMPMPLSIGLALAAAVCMAGFICFAHNVNSQKAEVVLPLGEPQNEAEAEQAAPLETEPIIKRPRERNGTVMLWFTEKRGGGVLNVPKSETALLLTWTIDGVSGSSVVRRFPAWLGRGEDCAVFINEKTVSRKHAVITFENGRFFIEDNNSGNGTFLNGERVNEKTAFSANDTFEFGHVCVSAESTA